MAITYPLVLPNSPGFNAVRFTARPVVAISESPFTLQTQVQEYSGQRLEVEATLPPMTRAQAEYWNTFMLKLNGMRGSFLLGDPTGKTPRGIATGTPVVNGASQTGNSLLTSGWTISITGILLAGDYIQIGTGSSSRLHKVLDDVNSDGSGLATLLLWPSLRSSPSNGTSIITSNTTGIFRLASNEITWNIGESIKYGITIAAKEVV